MTNAATTLSANNTPRLTDEEKDKLKRYTAINALPSVHVIRAVERRKGVNVAKKYCTRCAGRKRKKCLDCEELASKCTSNGKKLLFLLFQDSILRSI